MAAGARVTRRRPVPLTAPDLLRPPRRYPLPPPQLPTSVTHLSYPPQLPTSVTHLSYNERPGLCRAVERTRHRRADRRQGQVRRVRARFAASHETSASASPEFRGIGRLARINPGSDQPLSARGRARANILDHLCGASSHPVPLAYGPMRSIRSCPDGRIVLAPGRLIPRYFMQAGSTTRRGPDRWTAAKIKHASTNRTTFMICLAERNIGSDQCQILRMASASVCIRLDCSSAELSALRAWNAGRKI
jgi:hypothetical protein